MRRFARNDDHLFVQEVLGILNVFAPLLISFYYLVIEAAILAYTVFALTGRLSALKSQGENAVGDFLGSYLSGSVGPGLFLLPLLFFTATFLMNYSIIYRGIAGGIERISTRGIPVLGFFALVLFGRVLTLDASGPALQGTLGDGFGFFWNPDFSVLLDAKVWLAATGQIFFTLSLGLGAIMCYASYLRPKSDVALSSLTANATNTFAEVVLGGSIIVPAAVMFFGVAKAQSYAQEGTFTLGFVVMPVIFNKMAFGWFFATIWFGLLFLAALTSSVSLIQPVVAFLQNEFRLPRERAVVLVGAVNFVMSLFVLFGFTSGAVDEFDFWAVSFCAPLSALIMVVFYSWVIGVDKAFEETMVGAKYTIPSFFKVVIAYVTPTFLGLIFVVWFFQEGWRVVLLLKLNGPWYWMIPAKVLIVALFAGIMYILVIGRQYGKETAPKNSECR